MEAHAATLLAALKKPSTAVDTKLQLFTNLKSAIKHERCPDSAQPVILECIKLAITGNTSAALVATGFSTFGHLIKRLTLQHQTAVITSQSHKFLPILLERLGDAREGHRNAASQILAELWVLGCHAEVEALMRDSAMKGNNARAKDTSMSWLVKMNQNESLPFRSFVPLLVANLEDADAGVRETAKTTVVQLFQNAPEHAKVDLKKQLVTHNVRKTIATYITSHLSASSAPEPEMVAPPPRPISAARAESLQPDVGIADSMLSEQPPPVETVSMDPIHVYTQRELEEILRTMAPCFEGRETEQNWLARDKNTLKLRRITKGNAPHEFHGVFIAGIKSLLDGILKVANSLRTTMSTNGCQLIQELAKTLGPSMDPWVEILLQNFIKMCAATKNIAAQNGNTTVDTIFSNVSYTGRLMHHIQFAAQDKNVQPRIFSAGWLKTMVRKHKSPIEHHGGLDIVDKTVKKGVTDANPKVREAYRSTYWTFALVWPQRAEAMMETLDKREKNALEKDPNNPNASLASSQTSASTFSKSVGPGTARSTLKEKIAEQRRAKLAASRGVADRPSSAQATYSPVKSASAKPVNSRTASNASTASSTTARPPSALSGSSTKSALSANGSSTGGLMSGTVRRPMRRPELNRPATADPYAVRRAAGKNTTPSMTPEKTPAATVKKPVAPKSAARPRALTHNSQSSPNASPIRSKSRLAEAATHRKTPSIGSRHESPTASPSKDEDLTMVQPFGKPHKSVMSPEQGDDGNFTMVIPTLARPAAQAAQRSPPKAIQSPGRLGTASPLSVSLKSPRSMGDISAVQLARGSPRMRSPDRPSTRGTDADEVQVYEDPFVGDEPGAVVQDGEKPVLEELPLNEQNNERRQSIESEASDTMMGNGTEQQARGHHKTTSTGSVMNTDSNEGIKPEVLKNRQLLTSGINKIRTRTVEAHMFRRLQDMIKSNQDIWGIDDEKFGELLLAALDFLEAPAETLKIPASKVPNLKIQALATIRAMLSLYRKETAQYFSRVLVSLLRTKSQYENASHIALDLEATADEIVKYGQTTESLEAVLDLIENSPGSPPSSPDSKGSGNSLASTTQASNRTTTMALSTLSSLIQISSAKNVNLSSEQTARLGKLAVKCLDDTDADVRKADVEVCLSLHERIGGESQAFWKAVAGAREQHLNLITYYLAKRANRA